MPRLKVCGINSEGFAVYAAGRGADCLGFVFADASPRGVSPGTAKRIVAKVKESGPAAMPKFVGVFVNQDAGEIAAIGAAVGLDIVQLHGPYPDSAVAALKAEGFETWRLYNGSPGAEDAVLLDGRTGNESGMADWSLVAPLKAAGRRVVLAGGISQKNVAAAVATGADLIDVSSSLETAPGVKSARLLDSFLAAMLPLQR